MSEDTPPKVQPRSRLVVGLVGLGAAIAIAAGVFLYNGSTSAGECAVQAERASTIDIAAVGELAALNGTGQGRGYSTLAFEDDEGKPLTIKDFAGKRLLVNFWASWCVPCREEMPELDRLAQRYNSDDFMVLPINLDIGSEGVEKGRKFLEDGGWTHLPLYADPSFAAFDRLKTQAVAIGLPATLLLDEKGCELGVLQGPAAWDSTDGHNVIEALIAS